MVFHRGGKDIIMGEVHSNIYQDPLSGEDLSYMQIEELAVYYYNRMNKLLNIIDKYFKFKYD